MTDLILEAWVSSLIELAKLRPARCANDAWKPGAKLKLFLMAYNGARNTGEEVRVQEMVRQFRQIFGERNLALSVLTFNSERSRGYFAGCAQISLPSIFPPFLWREIPQFDGVVTAKGALFQHTFANASTSLMIGAMGLASAREKLSVAYGVEAGEMDRFVAKMCQRYCAQSLIILRNEESRAALQRLGLSSELGTDTAWTFEPHGPPFPQKRLHSAGWDDEQPVLAICPNLPFSWPVRASLMKAAARTFTGAYSESHYRSIYFHNSGTRAEADYRHYVKGISNAVNRFRKEHKVFPILVGMERLDEDACIRISERLGRCRYSPQTTTTCSSS
jgi:polysaccharide pyruvyl transferase WcaK-like protein